MSARIAAVAAASEVYQRQQRQQQRLAASLNQIHDKAIADGTHVERTRALVDSEIAAMGGFGLTQLDARMAKRWAAIEERSKLEGERRSRLVGGLLEEHGRAPRLAAARSAEGELHAAAAEAPTAEVHPGEEAETTGAQPEAKHGAKQECASPGAAIGAERWEGMWFHQRGMSPPRWCTGRGEHPSSPSAGGQATPRLQGSSESHGGEDDPCARGMVQSEPQAVTEGGSSSSSSDDTAGGSVSVAGVRCRYRALRRVPIRRGASLRSQKCGVLLPGDIIDVVGSATVLAECDGDGDGHGGGGDDDDASDGGGVRVRWLKFGAGWISERPPLSPATLNVEPIALRASRPRRAHGTARYIAERRECDPHARGVVHAPPPPPRRRGRQHEGAGAGRRRPATPIAGSQARKLGMPITARYRLADLQGSSWRESCRHFGGAAAGARPGVEGGIPAHTREMWLEDGEFERAFGMSKAAFMRKHRAERSRLKRVLDLEP
jgi:hypothetical protein